MPLGRVLALTLLNRFSRSYLSQKPKLPPPGTGYDRKNPAFTSGGNRTGSFFAYYPSLDVFHVGLTPPRSLADKC